MNQLQHPERVGREVHKAILRCPTRDHSRIHTKQLARCRNENGIRKTKQKQSTGSRPCLAFARSFSGFRVKRCK